MNSFKDKFLDFESYNFDELVDTDLISKRRFKDSDIISKNKLTFFLLLFSKKINQKNNKQKVNLFLLSSSFFKEYFFSSLHKSSSFTEKIKKKHLINFNFKIYEQFYYYYRNFCLFYKGGIFINRFHFNERLIHEQMLSFLKTESTITGKNPLTFFLKEYKGYNHSLFVKGMFLILDKWVLVDYIPFMEDYRSYFFEDKVLIHKGTRIIIPLMLRLEPKVPIDYIRKKQGYTKLKVIKYPLFFNTFWDFYYHCQKSLGISYLLFSFLFSKNVILGVFKEKGWTSLKRRLKNISLFFKFKDNELEVFSKLCLRSFRPENYPLLITYLKYREFFFTKKEFYVLTSRFKEYGMENFDLRNVFLEIPCIPRDTFTNMVYNTILVKVSRGIQGISRKTFLRSKFSIPYSLKFLNLLDTINKNYIARNSSESRILNIYFIFEYNVFSSNLRAFYRPIFSNAYFSNKQFLKPEPFLELGIKKIPRYKNWLASSDGFIIVRSWVRKVHIEERTIDYRISHIPIFVEPEPERIFIRILAKNFFLFTGRSMGSGFYNSNYCFFDCIKISKVVLKLFYDLEKKYIPKLPFKKRNTYFVYSLQEFIKSLDFEGYLYSSTRLCLKIFKRLSGFKHIFLQPGFFFFSPRRVYPWISGQKSIVHPGLSGLHFSQTAFYFNLLFSNKLKLSPQILAFFYYFLCVVQRRKWEDYNPLSQKIFSLKKQFLWLDQNSNYLTKFLGVEEISPQIGNLGSYPNSLSYFSFFVPPIKLNKLTDRSYTHTLNLYSSFFYNLFAQKNYNFSGQINYKKKNFSLRKLRNFYLSTTTKDVGFHLADASFCGDYSNLFVDYKITEYLRKKGFLTGEIDKKEDSDNLIRLMSKYHYLDLKKELYDYFREK